MPPKVAKRVTERAGARKRQQSVSFKGGRRGADDVAGGSIADAEVKRTGTLLLDRPSIPGAVAARHRLSAGPDPRPRLVLLGGKTIEYWMLSSAEPTADDVAVARAEAPLGMVALSEVLSVSAKSGFLHSEEPTGGGSGDGEGTGWKELHGLVVQAQFRSYTFWATGGATERDEWVAAISSAVDDWQELTELLGEPDNAAGDEGGSGGDETAAMAHRLEAAKAALLRSQQTASAKAAAAERYREDAALAEASAEELKAEASLLRSRVARMEANTAGIGHVLSDASEQIRVSNYVPYRPLWSEGPAHTGWSSAF